MDKRYVDKIISEYFKKIFGFSLTKTMNTDKAEELASRIVFDVYTSLLKVDNVYNIDGYIYRVSCNVYARFINEEKRGRYVALDEVNISSEDNFTDDFERNETFIRLRQEISYLNKIQREVIVLYYFEKLKQYEISELLNIPIGSIKWHLHEAKNQIKESINKMKEKGTLGINPIRFTGMGHSGSAGLRGEDTNFYLSKLISQNIAYSAYHEAKTVTEIAKELNVSAVFIEDEVLHLEKNGFLIKQSGSKYLTNIFISEHSKESTEQKNAIHKECAKIVCEKFVPLIIGTVKSFKSEVIYSPENDLNFLLWNIITYACGKKLQHKTKEIDLSNYYIKNGDGGNYIAMATVDSDFDENSLCFNPELYEACGDMTRYTDNGSIYSWQLNTYYDDREGNWVNNYNSDYLWLYEVMTGKIKKEPVHADKFKRLYDKGYIVSKDNSDYINMVVTKLSEKDFSALLPEITQELIEIGEEFDKKLLKTILKNYPRHIQDLCHIWNTNCLSQNTTRVMVLEELLNQGILKPLTENQKHSVNTIMFCDSLPCED